MSDKLNDDSIMTFGKYKGTTMEKVPASYLHWLWTENKKSSSRTDLKTSQVIDYIKDNLSALKMEYPDGLWD